MPTRNRIYLKALLPLGLLVVAVFALVRRGGDDWEYEQADTVTDDAPQVLHVARRRPAARFALAAAFTTIFFAGASFTAGAGDKMALLLDEDAAAPTEVSDITAGTEAVTTDAQLAEVEATEAVAAPAEAAPAAEPAAAEPAAAEPAAAEPVAAAEPAAAEPAAAEPAAAEPAAAEPASEVVAPEAAGSQNAPAADAALEPQAVTAEQDASNVVAPASAEPSAYAETPAQAAPTPAAKPAAKPAPKPAHTHGPTKQWVVKRAGIAPTVAPEIEHEGEPTIWLNRALPDPTPASARLVRSFAKALATASKRNGADWAAVLGVLRAQGERGSVPATAAELDTLASRLARENAWKGALAVSGRTAFADRAEALADLYRSVGIEALVTGFEAAKVRLAEQLLADERVSIYGSGRADVAAGRIDVRVIVLIAYLAERHGSVTVSSLFSGHRKFARPGVVSAHVYGHAVDIAAVGGTAIAGSQQPGGLTEAAVRSVLLLPAELQPQQVISLLGLGGPSFPLRDHGDHIHVGF